MRNVLALAAIVALAGCATARVDAAPSGRLSVDEVARLCRAGVDGWTIEAQIRDQGMERASTPDEVEMLRAAGATEAVLAATLTSRAPRVTGDSYAPPRTENVCYRETRYVALFPTWGCDEGRPLRPSTPEAETALGAAEFGVHLLLAVLQCLRR
jgi:hypothetical protein